MAVDNYTEAQGFTNEVAVLIDSVNMRLTTAENSMAQALADQQTFETRFQDVKTWADTALASQPSNVAIQDMVAELDNYWADYQANVAVAYAARALAAIRPAVRAGAAVQLLNLIENMESLG